MSTLENVPHKTMAKEERFWPRRRCEYISEYYDAYGNRCSCKVVDIGGYGLGIAESAMLRQGEVIRLADPWTKARVVWVGQGRAGLRVCY